MSTSLRSDDLPPETVLSSARPAPTVLGPALDHEPTIVLTVQVSGSTLVAQGDRQAVLGPGDLVVYDGSRPHTVLRTDRAELRSFALSRRALAARDEALDAVCGLRIAPEDNPLARVVAAYFAALADGPAALLAGPSIDLVRALLAAQPARREPAAAPLVGRVREYVRAHLADRDLTAASIAAAHHVSVRHLYASLARAGIGLHDTIRSWRLEECRRDLRAPACAHLTVGSVGARWGFADASHFGRMFRAAYGVTPREWRSGRG